MPTVQQSEEPTPAEKQTAINFSVPEDFKLAVDLAVKIRRTTLREFCTRVLAKELGIPVPGEESDSKSKSRKAS